MKMFALLFACTGLLLGCTGEEGSDDTPSDPDVGLDASAVDDAGAVDGTFVVDAEGPDGADPVSDAGVDGESPMADAAESVDAMIVPPADAALADAAGPTALDIEVSPADDHYRELWWSRDADFVTSLKWLPHFIYEQGDVATCIRLEMRTPRELTGADIEDIRRMIEEGVQAWQRGLVGEPNWPDIPLADVHIFGIAHTDVVQLVDPPDVPIYVNAEAKCPDSCSRFHQRLAEPPDYSQCPRQDIDHFDFTSWYSDFDFGAAGHGGDWGTRLAWGVHLDERDGRHQRVTDHEIGHIAGLPDIYNYPRRDGGHQRPVGIMAEDVQIRDFDYLMLRRVWATGFEAFYAD